MNPIPRTFCITLRETPIRKAESQRYFEQVGLKAEFFDGIHGKSFGLKSTIPNYEIIPGREYFITPGHVGCILSHLMLWNILIHQPEDEFLILEDDVILCENFFEKFANFKLELPSDWEMAYVGWIPNDKDDVTYVSEKVVILTPMCTHAYLVKKSALKVLIETNQLAWSHIDIQIVEKSLPKLKYYVSKESLVTQRSVCNIKDELWYSLCTDWNLDPEWLSIAKSTNIRIGNGKTPLVRLGNGWHPLEKNNDGYMIWSDGRGEFIFDDKWMKMKIDFITEADIEKKLTVVCPQQNDQVFELTGGFQSFTINITEAPSIVLVSDTFRPIDIYKTSDSRSLGLRLLKGITLYDKNDHEQFVSVYSMYGAKKAVDLINIKDVRLTKIKYSHEDGKVNIHGQISPNNRRSGWGQVIDLFTDYHRDDATLFDTWIERTFFWEKNRNSQLRFIPYREPWIGVFHNPPNLPNWITNFSNSCNIVNTEEFKQSLPMCQGLYTLSKYHADFLKCIIKDVPIETIYRPTEIPDIKFSLDKFIVNNNKKIINIGWAGRKLSSIYQLEIDKSIYQKIRLLPSMIWNPPSQIEEILQIEQNFLVSKITDAMRTSVIDVRQLSNDNYDDILSKNIVFLDLYDSSANNVIIECIARGTPVLVNPLPAVKEYLGEEYPFYFTNLDEASIKIKNVELIKETHKYLLNEDIIEKITSEYFIKSVREGQIWKSLR